MLKKIIFYCIIIILIACQSGNKIKKEEINKNIIIEKNTDLKLFDFSYFTETTGSNKNDINNINYNIEIKLQGNDNINQLDYIISDENDKILLNKKNIKPKIDSNDILIIKDTFISKLSYNKLKYTIKTFIKNEIKEINDEVLNKEFPILQDLIIGPIISQYIDNKLNVSLNVNAIINNCNYLKWIRLIPPSQNYFWDIPWLKEEDLITANAIIYEKNKNFLENGNYILQINFDNFGVYQKNIDIIDYLNNTKGANYGIPIPNIVTDEKEYLKLKIFDINSIDYIEIWLYIKENEEYIIQGIAKINPDNIINKKNLKESFKDEENNKIKIKNNYIYYAKIKLNSKKYNNLNYLSVSDYFQLKFHGFSIPFFN